LTGNFITISEDLLGYGVQPFEGPLDLLLYLIRQDEVDIYDIPIAKITGQYLAYLEAMKELDLEIAGEFILMASMLIRIKAQMLLPKPEAEDMEIDDPRSELVAALLEYKKFKQAAEELSRRGKDWSIRFHRGNQPEVINPEINYVLGKVDITALMIAFGEVMERVKTQRFHNVSTDEIRIEDRIRHIVRLMASSTDGFEFYQLFEDDTRRPVLVVTFLAILELARLGYISVRQSVLFSKIWVYPTELNIEEVIEQYGENS